MFICISGSNLLLTGTLQIFFDLKWLSSFIQFWWSYIEFNEGRIICSNTLDARLQMAFEQNLPAIRTILYGKSTTRMHYD